jgi:crotonobetainyl-CoA:carnitine CoA-transferase CaiB-like acyl-CoA transferase
MGAFGIVAALTHRDRTGVGARVDANMVDSATWVLAEQLARAANAPGPPWGSSARRANYRCADGRWVTCTASEPKPWAKLVEALDVPELAANQMGVDEGATRARLTQVFATRPQSHWLEHPGMAGGIGPVYEPADLIGDPQVTHRLGMVPIAAGGPLVFANPLRINGVHGDAGSHALGTPPELGEHTDTALTAAGFSADEISSLRADGVVI